MQDISTGKPTMGQNIKPNILLLLGAVSGVLSSISFVNDFDPTPGILFAIFCGGYLLCCSPHKHRANFLRFVVFVAISVLAYQAAFWTAFYIALSMLGDIWSGGHSVFSLAVAGIVAGAVGGFIVINGFRIIGASFSWKQIWQLTAVAGSLGVLLSVSELRILPAFIANYNGALFVGWQAGLAYALGRVLQG